MDTLIITLTYGAAILAAGLAIRCLFLSNKYWDLHTQFFKLKSDRDNWQREARRLQRNKQPRDSSGRFTKSIDPIRQQAANTYTR